MNDKPDKVTKCFVKTLGCNAEQVKDDATFDDLLMDQLDVADLTMSLESEFYISLEDRDWPESDKIMETTVKYVRDLVQRKLEEKTVK